MTVFLVNPSGRRAKNPRRSSARSSRGELPAAPSATHYKGWRIVPLAGGGYAVHDPAGAAVLSHYQPTLEAAKETVRMVANPPKRRTNPAALRWLYVGVERESGRDTWYGYHNVSGGDRVATIRMIGPGRYSAYTYPGGRNISSGRGSLAVAQRDAGRWWNLHKGAPRGARSSNPKGGRNMARRMPPRNAKGRFVKRGSTKRKARRRAAARTAPKRRRRRRSNPAPAARRRRRRNPPRLDVVGRLSGGFMDALALTGGQAAVRIIPRTLRLPTAGMVGLAVSSAVGVGVGMLAEQVVTRDTARLITAGALSVPLQQAALQYVAPAVPFVGAALSPTLGSYARTRLGAYSRQSLPAPARRARVNARGMAGYDYAAVGGGSY